MRITRYGLFGLICDAGSTLTYFIEGTKLEKLPAGRFLLITRVNLCFLVLDVGKIPSAVFVYGADFSARSNVNSKRDGRINMLVSIISGIYRRVTRISILF